MIKRIVVSNYKSLGENLVIDCNRLTAFVGANGSGKSNIVDIPRFISDSMRLGLEGAVTKRHGIKALRRWSSGKPYVVSIQIEIEDSGTKAQYEFKITSHKKYEYIVKYERARVIDQNGEVFEYVIRDQKLFTRLQGLNPQIGPMSLMLPLIAADERFKKLGSALSNMAVYTVFPDTLREPQLYDANKPMEQHGRNWTSILKDQPNESWKHNLLAALSQLTGEIDDIEIRQLSGYLIARFRHGTTESEVPKPRWFDASQESDGTLRTAGIISALLQRPTVDVIGIEEPELTVHPGAIPLLLDYIREATTASQILLTTHSPELLDGLDPDDVRVVEKINGKTLVSTMRDDQRNVVRSGLMSLGTLHRTEGISSSQLAIDYEG
jgi:predicted ATPase